jgi:hypothetical protein
MAYRKRQTRMTNKERLGKLKSTIAWLVGQQATEKVLIEYERQVAEVGQQIEKDRLHRQVR